MLRMRPSGHTSFRDKKFFYGDVQTGRIKVNVALMQYASFNQIIFAALMMDNHTARSVNHQIMGD